MPMIDKPHDAGAFTNDHGEEWWKKPGATPDRLTIEEWLMERAENCERLMDTKDVPERSGWMEDAAYFRATLMKLATQKSLLSQALCYVEEHEEEGELTAMILEAL